MSAVCLVLLVIGMPGGDNDSLKSWVVRLLALVVLAGLLASHVYFTQIRQLRKPRRAAFFPLSDDQAERLQRSLRNGTPIGMDEARHFTAAVIVPAGIRQRTVVHYRISRRTLIETVHIEARIRRKCVVRAAGSASDDESAGAPVDEQAPTTGRVLLPVVMPRKGELLDELSVWGRDGVPLPTLTYEEYLILAANILRTLVNGVCGGILTDAVLVAERNALRGIIRRGADRPGGDAARELERLTGNPVLRGMATRLVRQLCDRYAVVVSVPVEPDGRVTMSYSHAVTPTLEFAGGRNAIPRTVSSALRVVLGARPVGVSLPLDQAWTSQSYHLRVDSDESTYLAKQDAPEIERYVRELTPEGGERNPGGGPMPAPPHYRFRSRLGQSYAHFYCRYFPEPVRADNGATGVAPRVTFRFHEVPPGSTLKAVVASTLSTMLIWVVAMAIERGRPLTDAPLILLAMSALTSAAWMGFDRPRNRLMNGSLAARLSLAETFVLSVVAGIVYTMNRSEDDGPRGLVMSSVSVLGVHDLWWSVLVLASFLNTGFIVYTHGLRSWEYLTLSRRENRFSKIRVGNVHR